MSLAQYGLIVIAGTAGLLLWGWAVARLLRMVKRRPPSSGPMFWVLLFLSSGRMPPPPPKSQIEAATNEKKNRGVGSRLPEE